MASDLGPGMGVQCPTPRDLISNIANSHKNLAQFSTFSTAIYDSAWLSMIYKRDLEQDQNQPFHLFSECFELILKEQGGDGSWTCYGSRFDAILNSLAALLALVTYRRTCGAKFGTTELGNRIEGAESNIQRLLSEWDVGATVQVGFEVLVIGLLNQLQSFDIEFTFPAFPRLENLYKRKMQRFVPELIYSRKQMTIIHSLEALVGLIDFDQVGHHCCEETGIMASPAATAAYLIHSTVWDPRAERYLRRVLKAYSTNGSGRVPSAFPTSVFEITWTLSSMLSSVIELEDLDLDVVSTITSFLTRTMQLKDGTTGFAPGVLSDADDTARTLMTLQLLKRPTNFAPMIQQFESQDHFRTYEMERNPSFSANCNVLLALLHLDDVDQYAAQVSKTLTFVLQKFEHDDVWDKWNLSPQYCLMLVAQVFVKVMQLYDVGHLQLLSGEVVEERIPVALCQILLRTLREQGEDGYWNKSIEETSYSVLTIAQCLCLHWNQRATAKLEDSLERGREYIRRQYPLEKGSCYFWVEKTTFESELLKVAYCSMAIHSKRSERRSSTRQTFCIPEADSKRMAQLLSTMPNFTDSHLASVDLILVEASHASRFLRRLRQDIVSRDQILMSRDKYLDFIPVIWAMCNSKGEHALPAKVVRDMAWLSLLNYQMDEFMETVVGQLDDRHIEILITALRKEFGYDNDRISIHLNQNEEGHEDDKSQRAAESSKLQNGSDSATYHNASSGEKLVSSSVEHVLTVLHRYITHIRTHEAVLASPPHVQSSLAHELHAFLLAHISHNTDNITFQQSNLSIEDKGFACPDIKRSSYFTWVHTTGANDTGCPFSFQFFACLVSYSSMIKGKCKEKSDCGKYCFESTRAGYVAQSLARRLAVMCRMYNDYGSMVRDKTEGNLNSLDFAEFHVTSVQSAMRRKSGDPPSTNENRPEVPDNCEVNWNRPTNGMKLGAWDEKTSKEELMEIAEFERMGMELAMRRLEQIIQDKDVLRMVRVFVDVTDTFGLLYVQKDIASSRIK